MVQRNYYNDWVLPVVTTFIGVFAAAYLTIWYEDRNEDEGVERLLVVAHTDACAALGTAERAAIVLQDDAGNGQLGGISAPKILIAVIQDNAKSLADFHPELATELVEHLALIESRTTAFGLTLASWERIHRMQPYLAEESRRGAEVLADESARLWQRAGKLAAGIASRLQRVTFLLERQLQHIHGELSSAEVSHQLAQDSFIVDCGLQGQTDG